MADAKHRQFRVLHVAETVKGRVGTYLRDLLVLQGSEFPAGSVVALVPKSQAAILGKPQGYDLELFEDVANRKMSALRLLCQVYPALKRHSPDIVHIHSTFAGVVVRLISLVCRTRAKIVYCPHGWAFDRESGLLARCGIGKVERILSPLSDAIVCISEYERQAALRIGIPHARLVVIRNGVPSKVYGGGVHRQPEWPSGRRRILFVGRFDRQKGIDVLIEALRQLGDSVFAFLVGEAVHGGGGAFDLPPNASQVGWLGSEQLEAYYQTADIVVVPSRWEGFGLVAAEAARAGVAVVASNVGGLREVVKDGVTGVLVPPADVNALVSAIRRLTPGDLRRYGDEAKRHFQLELTMERMHSELGELYSRLLNTVPESGRQER